MNPSQEEMDKFLPRVSTFSRDSLDSRTLRTDQDTKQSLSAVQAGRYLRGEIDLHDFTRGEFGNAFEDYQAELVTLPSDYRFLVPGGGPLVDLQGPLEPSLLNLVVGRPTQIVDYKQMSVHFSTEFPGSACPKLSTAWILQQEHLRIDLNMGRGVKVLDAPVRPPSRSDLEGSGGTSHRELELQLLDVQVQLEQMEARPFEVEVKVMEYMHQGSALQSVSCASVDQPVQTSPQATPIRRDQMIQSTSIPQQVPLPQLLPRAQSTLYPQPTPMPS
uniref:Uncharacterized protein n=1 Tax=Sphaerodactylus townsendi TaxID=933632 RepID=A0ACB8FNX2_9SAUR